MLRFTVPVEKGNQAIKNGSLARTMESLLKELKPEAAYFLPTEGERSGMIVFNMKDSSDIPKIAERLFTNLDAAVDFTPVMTAADLRKGLGKISAKKSPAKKSAAKKAPARKSPAKKAPARKAPARKAPAKK